jgi:hypothetical protein
MNSFSSFKPPKSGEYWEFTYDSVADYAVYVIKVLSVSNTSKSTEWCVVGHVTRIKSVSDKRIHEYLLAHKSFTITNQHWRRVNADGNACDVLDMWDVLENILYSS